MVTRWAEISPHSASFIEMHKTVNEYRKKILSSLDELYLKDESLTLVEEEGNICGWLEFRGGKYYVRDGGGNKHFILPELVMCIDLNTLGDVHIRIISEL